MSKKLKVMIIAVMAVVLVGGATGAVIVSINAHIGCECTLG